MPQEVLELVAGDDHVERLAHRDDPLRAVVELVWNAVDAEASRVTVGIERNDAGGIDRVVVADDGHGISPDEVATTFGTIGASWKRPGGKTKNGKRTLHGARGEGRLRAFALGTVIEWDSHANDSAGVLHHVRVTGRSPDYRRFPRVVETVAGNVATGTRFTADNLGQRTLAALDSNDAHPRLLAHFAPVLLNDSDIEIAYDGSRLDPDDHIAHDTIYTVLFADQTALLRIIEWKSTSRRTPRLAYVGSDGTHFPYEEPATRMESQLPFTAYVTWPNFGEAEQSTISLHDGGSGLVPEMWAAVEEKVREHFGQRRRQQRGDQIRRWKQTGAYPYKGKPANSSEKAERAVFDVISSTLAPHIAQDQNLAKVTLHLLQGAVRHDPGTLTTILHEVVSLSKADAAAFTRLLQETTLPAIIRTTGMVADRRKVLEGLNHILFDPDDSKRVGERDHLHKILERELWIFGEGYNVMRSERGLTDLARTHLNLAGLPDDTTPVVRHDGRAGRTDLHLAVSDKQHDRIRHLVVELKAPHVTLGRAELDQVEDYANTILDHPAFATGRSEWDFILIGTKRDDVARRKIIDARDDGLYWQPTEQGRPRVRAFVRTWSDMIAENTQRLDFLSCGLELDPSIEEGLRHLQTVYSELLPTELRAGERSA